MRTKGVMIGVMRMTAGLFALVLVSSAAPNSWSQAQVQAGPASVDAETKSRANKRMGPRRPPATRRGVVQAQAPQAGPVEKIEIDVSTRIVRVTAAFAGREIIVFGSIDNSQQPSDKPGYYDLVVVVEGTAEPIVVRRKSDVAGLWINTSSVVFASVPSYYAIASTRPIDEIAGPNVLNKHAIGFAHIKMTLDPDYQRSVSEEQLAAYKAAVIRLKQQEGLYVVKAKDGVTFRGRSLFRSTISLPANVPVGGPLIARVFLFREGEVISAHIVRVTLELAGLERILHHFAFNYPFTYGIFAVILAVLSGLLASAYFRRELR
ncbi:MAG: TIGR02186 family protein [Hyphomicrobium sp.]